jgi:hypothetical protein
MPQFQDLTGQTFGRLRVIERAPDHVSPSGNKTVMWFCECSCPNHTRVKVNGSDLRRGRTRSCGCWKTDYRQEKPSEELPQNRNLPVSRSARAEQLAIMHKLMLASNNPNIYTTWTRYIPDGTTETGFYKIAGDVEHYDKCCDAFAKLVQRKSMRW